MTAPSRVDDHYKYWGTPPPEGSERCEHWVRKIQAGWRPNRRIRGMGYDEAAEWFGVYMWEYLNVLRLVMTLAQRRDEVEAARAQGGEQLARAMRRLHDLTATSENAAASPVD